MTTPRVCGSSCTTGKWTPTSGNLFRIDPHVFNNHDDVDRFLVGLDAFNAK